MTSTQATATPPTSRPPHARAVAVGATLPARALTSIAGAHVEIPRPDAIVHLQLRRFAGCPVCSLHLRSVARRREEIAAASIHEVVVFHSSREELLRYEADLPFDVVADPDKRLYRELGAEAHPRALLNPRAWLPIARAVFASAATLVRRRGPLPPLVPSGGRTGLPADLLIGRDGRVLACKYGRHADDQWSVDELLAHARADGVGE